MQQEISVGEHLQIVGVVSAGNLPFDRAARREDDHAALVLADDGVGDEAVFRANLREGSIGLHLGELTGDDVGNRSVARAKGQHGVGGRESNRGEGGVALGPRGEYGKVADQCVEVALFHTGHFHANRAVGSDDARLGRALERPYFRGRIVGNADASRVEVGNGLDRRILLHQRADAAAGEVWAGERELGRSVFVDEETVGDDIDLALAQRLELLGLGHHLLFNLPAQALGKFGDDIVVETAIGITPRRRLPVRRIHARSADAQRSRARGERVGVERRKVETRGHFLRKGSDGADDQRHSVGGQLRIDLVGAVGDLVVVLVILAAEQHRGNAHAQKRALVAALQPIRMSVDCELHRNLRRKAHEQINEHLALRPTVEADRAVGLARNHVHVEHAADARGGNGLLLDKGSAADEAGFLTRERDKHHADIQLVVAHGLCNRDHTAGSAGVVVGSVIDAVFALGSGGLRGEVVVVRADDDELASRIVARRGKPCDHVRRRVLHAADRHEHGLVASLVLDQRLRTSIGELLRDPFRGALAIFGAERSPVHRVRRELDNIRLEQGRIDLRNDRRVASGEDRRTGEEREQGSGAGEWLHSRSVAEARLRGDSTAGPSQRHCGDRTSTRHASKRAPP